MQFEKLIEYLRTHHGLGTDADEAAAKALGRSLVKSGAMSIDMYRDLCAGKLLPRFEPDTVPAMSSDEIAAVYREADAARESVLRQARKGGKEPPPQPSGGMRVQVVKISPHDIAEKIAHQTQTPKVDGPPPTEAGINEVYELAETAFGAIWALRTCLATKSAHLNETWWLLAQVVEQLMAHPQKEQVRKLLPLRRMLLGSGIPITSTSLNVVLLCVKLASEAVDGALRNFPWSSVNEPHPQFWQAVLAGLVRLPTLEHGSFLDDLNDERSRAILTVRALQPAQQASTTTVPDQMVTMKQMGAVVNKTKAAIEKIKHKLPPPDVRGGSGKASEWEWSKVRPILAEHFHRPTLPEIWPADRFRRR